MASSPIASASRARSMSAKDGGASMEGLADAARAWRIEHICDSQSIARKAHGDNNTNMYWIMYKPREV